MVASRPFLATIVAVVLTASLGLAAWISGTLATAATRTVTWTPVASQPFGTSEAVGLAVGGKLYSFGGFDSTRSTATPTSRAYVYDPAGNRWSAIRSLPAFNGRSGGVSHAGIATDGTSIYIAGGYSADEAGVRQTFGSRDVYRYSPGSDTYTRLPSLPAERGGGTMAYVDGSLHFMGGTDLTRVRECPEHWALDLSDLGAGWVARASMPSARNHLQSSVAGGRIYAIGGQTGQNGDATPSRTVNAYDPATNAWTTVTSLPRPLNHSTATTWNGQLVVLGGWTVYPQPLADVYAFDPAANAWVTMTPLPAPRAAGTSGTIGNTIYFTGGASGFGRSGATWRGTPSPTGPPDPTDPPDPGTPTGADRSFNFQPGGRPVPSGFTADTGLGFSAARGFGWVRQDSLAQPAHAALDLTANTRDRGALSDQRLDTLIHMQATSAVNPSVKTAGAWELGVTNGSYRVTVTVGDPLYTDSVHSVRVEGVPAVTGFVPSGTTRDRTATVTVPVSDGRLTVDAAGGTNTKLDFVTVVPGG